MNSPHNRLLLQNPLSDHTLPRSEKAHEFLRTELLEGGLRPGDKLSVVSITKQLSSSRAPVMEALKRLESDGFIEIIPQVGCRVVTPKVNDVSDFFALFAVVEASVIALAAKRRTELDLIHFELLCDRIDRESALAGGPDDNDPSYRTLNLLFHSAIHEMARSPVSTSYAATLWDRSDFYIKLAFGSLYFSNTVKRSHRAMRKAIISSNIEAAKAAVINHLKTVGNSVTRALLKQQNG